ncbi:MAG: hypothetical protein H5T62_15995 [Anaerolineae bacterium]|nr:hypothetical protein [Anaerolineae bacterium]
MKQAKQVRHELLLELVAFSILVTSVVLLWRNNPLLLSVMVVECLVALLFWHDPLDVSFFLIIAVLGSLAELVFVRFGVWRYSNPTFLGIPLWFPWAFGTTGLIGARLARTMVGLWEQRRALRVSEE